MNGELVIVTLIVAVGTWAVRFLPTKLPLDTIAPGGRVSRFLNATGPAAIAALTVATFLPLLEADLGALTLLGAGVAGTVGGFFIKRDISFATLAGALVYGLAYWAMAAPW